MQYCDDLGMEGLMGSEKAGSSSRSPFVKQKGLEESLMGVIKDTEVDTHALWAICGMVGFE